MAMRTGLIRRNAPSLDWLNYRGMRSRRFQRGWLALALTAGLLLTLLPTLGRLQRALNPDPLAAGWAALCTMGGLATLPSDAFGATGNGDRGNRGQAGDDCPYCPLLATISLLGGLLLAWLLPCLFALGLRPPVRVLVRATWHPCGLGSRGPPLIAA
jgi:hypothetical protein